MKPRTTIKIVVRREPDSEYYKLVQLQNAVTIETANNTRYRVGDLMLECTINYFCGLSRYVVTVNQSTNKL